jgi:hypothetical protein
MPGSHVVLLRQRPTADGAIARIERDVSHSGARRTKGVGRTARIKLKYVNAFANWGRKDKRVRYYFLRRGRKAIPLPGVSGSEEFMADKRWTG